MKTNRQALMLATALAWPCFAQAQDGSALSGEELARCAQQVRQLRAESGRLMREYDQIGVQRGDIEARRRQVEATAETQDGKDLQANLALSERRGRLNREATALNARLSRMREDTSVLNGVKRNYQALCAQRPYRRSDLEQLPAEDQTAMRAGLDDVQVPYIDDSAPASPASAPGR